MALPKAEECGGGGSLGAAEEGGETKDGGERGRGCKCDGGGG